MVYINVFISICQYIHACIHYYTPVYIGIIHMHVLMHYHIIPLRTPVYISIHQYTKICRYTSVYTSVATPVCTGVTTPVLPYTGIYTNIHRYIHRCTLVYTGIHQYAQVYSRILVYVYNYTEYILVYTCVYTV